jgi:hypothetical protein
MSILFLDYLITFLNFLYYIVSNWICLYRMICRCERKQRKCHFKISRISLGTNDLNSLEQLRIELRTFQMCDANQLVAWFSEIVINLHFAYSIQIKPALNICSFVHPCNTFTSYFLLIVDMFRPHMAIFRCIVYSSEAGALLCQFLPMWCCQPCASHVLLLMLCLFFSVRLLE